MTAIPLSRRLRKSSLSARIMAGLVAGVLTGLVVGERAAVLEVVADAFIKLLQMTVLPYVVVSLISGLGALSFAEAKLLGLRVGAVIVVLWLIALAAVGMFPLMFPELETASFFSTTLVETPEAFDLVGLYIPANPFNSLANNVVPAVVLFSVVLGVALIGVPNKAPLLTVLAVVNQAVSRASSVRGGRAAREAQEEDTCLFEGPDDEELRIRSEQFEELIAGFLYAVGNIRSPHILHPVVAIMKRFRRDRDASALVSPVLDLIPQTVVPAPDKPVDLGPFVQAALDKYGVTGFKIAMEYVKAIEVFAHADPWAAF